MDVTRRSGFRCVNRRRSTQKPTAPAIPPLAVRRIGEARFRGLIAMQNRSLSTFLIVHHKVDREPRAARPPWIGWIGGIADEVTRIVGHGAVRSEAAASRGSSP